MGAFLLGLLLLFPSAQDADASGRIVGRVLIRGENIPVAGARVTLLAVRRGPIFNSGPPTPPPQVLSGADGSYAFDRGPPGEHRATASKTGLAAGPGSAAPGPGVVAGGQAIEIPDAFLDRAGAIVGRILDPNGEPLVDARVMALRPPPIPPQVLARGYVPPPDRPRPLMPAGSS